MGCSCGKKASAAKDVSGPGALPSPAPSAAGPVVRLQFPDKPEHVPEWLLTQPVADAIAAELPLRYQFRTEWVLAYSPAVHGTSMQGFHKGVRQYDATVLVIRDTADHVFGCFANTAWTESPQYFGSEALVFTFHDTQQVESYQNFDALVQYCSGETIMLGGGSDGNKALVVSLVDFRKTQIPDASLLHVGEYSWKL